MGCFLRVLALIGILVLVVGSLSFLFYLNQDVKFTPVEDIPPEGIIVD